MRVVLVGLLVFGAFAAGWWVRGEQDARSAGPARAAAPTPVERAAAQAKAEQCRDSCEQRAVVERQPDDWLRNCRNSCSGPPRDYDPIRSISRAPADHGKR